MRFKSLLVVAVLLVSVGFLSGNFSLEKIDGMLPTIGAENPAVPESPPPHDSVCLVFSGVDYGDAFSSPQNYVNAKHITNVSVGSYYFPVVIWEAGASWAGQSMFSYWDDLFKFWSYPDSFTSNQGQDTGRPCVCADSHGNLHFIWHQLGSPDGYESFYARAILDTSSGVIQYSVERPAVMVSATNGEEETFPVMAIYEDTLLVAIFNVGTIGGEHAINYNYSTDGGDTWGHHGVAYEHGTTMIGSWILPNIAADPSSGDMYATLNFDKSGDGSMDILGYHWDASTDTWTDETVANATSMHPYACHAVVVDYNGIPHIIFQENLTTTGGSGGLSGWNECGPAGSLFYTHRQGGSWSTPEKIVIPDLPAVQCNYCAGFPSAGLATDNTIYFSTTYPDSASTDTGSYLTFNVHYNEVSPYTGAANYGNKVSDLPWQSTTAAIYAHMTYNVPLDGPGITWCQMEAAAPPADVYYCHPDTILGITESEDVLVPSPVALYQNYPNPTSGKTMIRFTVPANMDITLNIYDITGRHIRTLASGIPGAGSYFTVWDGKDTGGKEVPGGIYLYTLKAGSYTETRKLLRVH